MVFLDWASTSPVIRFAADQYGNHCNPNAAYAEDERGLLREAEVRIKQAIGVEGGHVLYFRCATEAIKWLHDKSIVYQPDAEWFNSLTEHDSCDFGVVCSPEDVEEYCTRAVIGREHDVRADFYIHQWVNHVTGEIFNLKEIKAQLPENTRLVVDATAGFGKAKLPRNLENIASALFMSGHKIGCPELSFMWLNDELCEWLGAAKDIRNQWGLHHGSLSVASVLALTDAVEWACNRAYRVNVHSIDLCIDVYNLLDEACIERHDVPGSHAFAASINAIRLNGINADSLQQFLATRNIYIGVGGSACSAAHDYRVLRDGYGLTDDEAAEVIRVSFGPETTADDITVLVDGIREYRRQFC